MASTVYFVLGLCFNEKRDEVLLMRKNRPAWCAGQFAAVGGKVEPNEIHANAMIREFKEEAGVDTSREDWNGYFMELVDDQYRYRMLFYRAFSNRIFREAKQMETETLHRFPITLLPHIPLIDSLRWIIPLALDPHMIPSVRVQESRSDWSK